MNPGVYGPLDSATNLYTGLPINKQRVSTDHGTIRVDLNVEWHRPILVNSKLSEPFGTKINEDHIIATLVVVTYKDVRCRLVCINGVSEKIS